MLSHSGRSQSGLVELRKIEDPGQSVEISSQHGPLPLGGVVKLPIVHNLIDAPGHIQRTGDFRSSGAVGATRFELLPHDIQLLFQFTRAVVQTLLTKAVIESAAVQCPAKDSNESVAVVLSLA